MKLKPLHLTLLLSINCCVAFADSTQKLQAYFGASLFKYNLTSEQFGADQPMNDGQAYRINYSYQKHDSRNEHRLSWFNTSHDIPVPASLTPSNINYSQTKLNYRYVLNTDMINYGLGYSFQKVEAGATTPNILIGSFEAHTVTAYLEKTVLQKYDFSLQLFAALKLPVSRKELGTNTGFNQTSYTSQFGYIAKYLLNDAWSVVQETEYSLTTTSFDGQGNRGTLNAKEKNQNITILVGAGYDF